MERTPDLKWRKTPRVCVIAAPYMCNFNQVKKPNQFCFLAFTMGSRATLSCPSHKTVVRIKNPASVRLMLYLFWDAGTCTWTTQTEQGYYRIGEGESPMEERLGKQ